MDTKATETTGEARRLEPQIWGTGTIRLADVLREHEKHAPAESLATSTGDGFLCATNPVYRNVRASALALGYRFESRGHEDYFTFPLMSLGRIFETKVIPYRENFRWLETLERRAPGRFDLAALDRFDLRRNYVFHEAAHAMAHEAFRAAGSPSSPEHRLLEIVAGEAFANTVECASGIFFTGEIGQYFFRQNSYQVLAIEDSGPLFCALRDAGFLAAAKLLFYAFLYANFRFTALGPAEREALASLAGTSLPPETFSGLTELAMDLSESFRMETSPFYLMQAGFDDATIALLDQDPLALVRDYGAEKLAGVVETVLRDALRDANRELSWS